MRSRPSHPHPVTGDDPSARPARSTHRELHHQSRPLPAHRLEHHPDRISPLR